MNRVIQLMQRLLRTASLWGMGSLLTIGAWAQPSYPQRTIRIITPYGAGSMVDTTTRLVAHGLSRKFGQPVVVENRTGAFGLIAMNALMSAPADGYTLLTDTPAIAINPSLREVRYDPKTDIAPIAQLMRLPFVVAVHPELGVQDIQGLVALLKKPDTTVDAAVAGTSTGLATELFAMQSGIKVMQVPYKGASPAMLSTLKGETQLIVLDAANLTSHIQASKLQGLLITGEKRSTVLKDLPTAREAGLPNFQPSTWFGLFSLAGVPKEIQQKLNEAVLEVMKSHEAHELLDSRGASASSMNLDAFGTFFLAEVDTWATVVRKADIK